MGGLLYDEVRREAQPWCLVCADSVTRAGSGPRQGRPARPAFQASVQNPRILGTRPWSGGEGGLKSGEKISSQNGIFYIVENVRTLSGIVLVASRGLQLPHRKNRIKSDILTGNYQICSFLRIFFYPPLWMAPVVTPVCWHQPG